MLEGMIVWGGVQMAASRKQAVDTLHQQIFMQSMNALALLDERACWWQVNDSLQRLLGSAVRIGEPVRQSLEDATNFDESFASAATGAQLRQLPWVWRVDDQELMTLVALQRVEGVQPLRVLLSLQILPENEGGGIRDALTGLAGHALFMDRLQLALTRSRRNKTAVAVMMVSVDDYAPYRTERGEAEADALLQRIAVRLSASVRRSDTLARLGGDVFALVLEEVGSSLEAITLAAKICDSLDQDATVSLRQGISIGGVMAHADATPWDLIRRADEALREAQRHPGNAYEMAF